VNEAEIKAHQLLANIATVFPQSIWFADIDDTLIDTIEAHQLASQEIAVVLEPAIGERNALAIKEQFLEIFRVLMSGHRAFKATSQLDPTDIIGAQYRALRQRIEHYQQDLREQWGAIKVFSREVLLTLAGEDCSITLTPEQISKSINHYWEKVADYALCYDDSFQLLEAIAAMKRPLYLFTSSDGRLTLRADGQFEYDPQLSHQLKLARIERLRSKGLHYQGLFIGDPIDKPNPEFFEMIYKSVARDLGQEFRLENTIIIGDSYDADLHVPVSTWEKSLGILYRRGQEKVFAEKERVLAVGNWQVVRNLLVV